jgi:hypothetical protein
VEETDGGGVLGAISSSAGQRARRGDALGAAIVGGGETEQQLGVGVIQRREPDLADDDRPLRSTVNDLADGVVGQAAVESRPAQRR